MKQVLARWIAVLIAALVLATGGTANLSPTVSVPVQLQLAQDPGGSGGGGGGG